MKKSLLLRLQFIFAITFAADAAAEAGIPAANLKVPDAESGVAPAPEQVGIASQADSIWMFGDSLTLQEVTVVSHFQSRYSSPLRLNTVDNSQIARRATARTYPELIRYIPGVYTSDVTLNNTALEVEVTVDDSHINSIRFSNLDESVAAMYPLVQPAIEDIAEQIYDSQSLENIQYSSDSPYTSQLILQAVKDALEKARTS